MRFCVAISSTSLASMMIIFSSHALSHTRAHASHWSSFCTAMTLRDVSAVLIAMYSGAFGWILSLWNWMIFWIASEIFWTFGLGWFLRYSLNRSLSTWTPKLDIFRAFSALFAKLSTFLITAHFSMIFSTLSMTAAMPRAFITSSIAHCPNSYAFSGTCVRLFQRSAIRAFQSIDWIFCMISWIFISPRASAAPTLSMMASTEPLAKFCVKVLEVSYHSFSPLTPMYEYTCVRHSKTHRSIRSCRDFSWSCVDSGSGFCFLERNQ